MNLLQIINRIGHGITVDEINQIAEILRRIEAYGNSLKELQWKYQANRDKMREAIKDIQSLCKHQVQDYQGDPAGGSDSCHICQICGKEL